MKKGKFNRRNVLITIGSVAVGSFTSVGSVTAKKSEKLPSEDQLRAVLTDRYNESTADATINIFREYYPKKEENKISNEQFYDIVTEKLLADPKGRTVAEDVKKTENTMNNPNLLYGRDEVEVIDTGVSQSELESLEQNVSTSDTGETLLLTLAEKDKDTSGSASAMADIDYYYPGGDIAVPEKQNVQASSSIYGSAWAYVRFYYPYTPSSNGEYKVKTNYYRQGKAVGGGAQMSLYAEDESGSINSKICESVSGNPVGSVNYYKTFTLEGGETYNIGLETMCTSTTGGGAGYGDFGHNGVDYDRHVKETSLEIEQVG